MNRRQFSQTLVQSVASYALLHALSTARAFGRAVAPIAAHWLAELDTFCRDLKTDRITPRHWQAHVQALYDQVPLDDLLRLIDFERLARDFPYPDQGVHTERVRFPALDGVPEGLAFTRKLFGMKQDRAIIPHGHRNMVSCHYVVHGAFRLRHYDKLSEDATHMTIRPTVDTTAAPGSHSSISDDSDNIHWLKALTPTAFTFDVLVLDLHGDRWDVDNIDPRGAERLGDGALRVRKLDVAEALDRYGHDTHH